MGGVLTNGSGSDINNQVTKNVTDINCQECKKVIIESLKQIAGVKRQLEKLVSK